MKSADFSHHAIASLWEKQIFFIAGSMKSGTTWLQTLLNAHPEVSCRGEGHFIDGLGHSLSKAISSYNASIINRNSLVFGDYATPFYFGSGEVVALMKYAISLSLLKVQKSESCPIVGEKTPDNIRGLINLHRIFPEAKFIHLVRDGRDCAISGWFHNLRGNREWLEQAFPSLLDYVRAFAAEWAEDIRHGDSFQSSYPDQYIELRYEDLISDTAGTLSRALNFLGASVAPSFIEECCRQGDFRRLSGGRKPGEEDPNSFFRNGEAGNWREHFTPEMNGEFRRQAGREMDRLGIV